MPIIKSAKKRIRQNSVRRARNFPLRSKLKTVFKNVLALINEGKLDEAVKKMPHVYSVIDTAVKKKIIHINNGSRKKSRIAKAIAAATKK